MKSRSAASSLGISYRRAWSLVRVMNAECQIPLVLALVSHDASPVVRFYDTAGAKTRIPT